MKFKEKDFLYLDMDEDELNSDLDNFLEEDDEEKLTEEIKTNEFLNPDEFDEEEDFE